MTYIESGDLVMRYVPTHEEGLKWIQLSSARFMDQGLFRQTPLEGFETLGPFSVVH